MKLLYIDDDDIDRMAVSRMARKFPGIQFTAVDSMEAALPYFGEMMPLILFCQIFTWGSIHCLNLLTGLGIFHSLY